MEGQNSEKLTDAEKYKMLVSWSDKSRKIIYC